ncbi:TlyA family RNA methyltransferase [Campylobacter sp. MG1]|uniref:23S rRNA (cytidine-2'-O)-methyltransferase TlyA n=1 Tax=Campylobacter sp. MG1 TaxID=2976332 RepID=UPI00226CF3FF|nr:TlyA family RNA methyltransferase [Campylobacter sp. MG1]
MRADIFVSNNLKISRNKAAEMLKKGLILINDKIKKPSDDVNIDSICKVIDDIYVSRAAYKLKGFFDDFNLDISNFDCLDAGSSTGGFTQILLSKNVKSITCVDVGNNQLHISLRNIDKIKIYENTDIREFNVGTYDLVVSDLSFISTKIIMKDLIRLSKNYIIVLFKPQFEVGKNVKRNKKGVVIDEKAIKNACLEYEKEMAKLGLILEKKTISTLSGKEGNYEYFYAFRK